MAYFESDDIILGLFLECLNETVGRVMFYIYVRLRERKGEVKDMGERRKEGGREGGRDKWSEGGREGGREVVIGKEEGVG